MEKKRRISKKIPKRKSVNVRYSVEERKLIAAAAARQGMKISKFIRDTCVREARIALVAFRYGHPAGIVEICQNAQHFNSYPMRASDEEALKYVAELQRQLREQHPEGGE